MNTTTEPKKRNEITLKWGTLKGWNLKTDDAKQLLQAYHDEPVSFIVMMQRDTENQKEIILRLIDVCDEIHLEWEGRSVSREEAKDYILNYGESK